MATNLLQSIYDLYIDASTGADRISALLVREGFRLMEQGTLSDADTITGTIDSIDFYSVHQGNSTGVTDFPPKAAAGDFTVAAIKQVNLTITYLLTDSAGCIHTGFKLLAGTIDWKSPAYQFNTVKISEGTLDVYNNADVLKTIFSDNLILGLEDGNIHVVSFRYEAGFTINDFDVNGVVYYEDTGDVLRPVTSIEGTTVTVQEWKDIIYNSATLELQYDIANTTMLLVQVIQNSTLAVIPPGYLTADGGILLDTFYDIDAAPGLGLVSKDWVLANAGGVGLPSLPNDVPLGHLYNNRAADVDAVTTPYTISISMTGIAGRMYTAEANIFFVSNGPINGYVAYSTTTKDSLDAIERQDFGIKPVFFMDAASVTLTLPRFIQEFNKDTAGTIEFTFQLVNQWDNVVGTTVDLFIYDKGTGTVPANINYPPTASTVDLGILDIANSPLTITEATLLSTANDPESAPMTVTNVAITVGLGSIVPVGNDWEYSENGVTAVTLTYDISDGVNTIQNTATLDVTAAGNQPTMLTAAMYIFRQCRVDYDADVSCTTIASQSLMLLSGMSMTVNGNPAVLNRLNTTDYPGILYILVDSASQPVTDDVVLLSYDNTAQNADIIILPSGDPLDSFTDMVIDTTGI